jgi:hypothetical protein
MFLKSENSDRSDLIIRMLQGHFELKVPNFDFIFQTENKQQLLEVMLKMVRLTTFNQNQGNFP